jgi:hypothetical protein
VAKYKNKQAPALPTHLHWKYAEARQLRFGQVQQGITLKAEGIQDTSPAPHVIP